MRHVPKVGVLLAAVWFAAFNLRAGFIGLGPVLPDLAADLGLSSTAASTLVSIPTLMMGLVAVTGGALADRWGASRAVSLGLLLVALGGGMRATVGGFPPLVAWTVLFGAGIGLAQPALPKLVRGVAPDRLGLVTGIYSSGMVTGSILAASLTLPVAHALAPEAGWRGPLLFWSAVAAIALAVWLVAVRPWAWSGNVLRSQPAPAHGGQALGGPDRGVPAGWSPWRDRRVWVIALLFAAQGLAYYLLIAWLPAVYRDLGVSPGRSGALFAVYNAATLPAIIGFPVVSDRIGSRRIPCLVASAMFVAGSLGLALAPLAGPLTWAWPALAGAGVAAVFAMTLVLPADVAPAARVGAAAGMTLAIGYGGSALGPILAGAIHDLTGGFEVALFTLPVVGVAMVLLSLAVPEMQRRRLARP